MKIVCAIDSFKGSLSSVSAGEAVKRAALKVSPEASVKVFPLADGGEGTTDAFCSLPGSETVFVDVHGPRLSPVKAKYCALGDKKTAVMEMASAAGITLLKKEELDPLVTTTFGVGEMIKDAISRGCRDFIVGIGGSATNDGGSGMLSALGVRFSDKEGKAISFGAGGLEKLENIDVSGLLPELRDCRFRIACDVKNPLLGEMGCSAVFGPQKGAPPEDVKRMDKALARYAQMMKTVFPCADPDHPGAGAAGGLGFAFKALGNASLSPGIDIVIGETGLEKEIMDADIVVTGEGRLDSQTVMGKAPIGVARVAKKYAKKVIAFSGCVADGAEACNEYGIDAYFPILQSVVSLSEAMETENAEKNLQKTAEQVFRLILL